MYVYIHVLVGACMYPRMSLCIYVCVHVCIHVHIYVCCMYVCLFVLSMFDRACVRLHVCVWVCVCVCICLSGMYATYFNTFDKPVAAVVARRHISVTTTVAHSIPPDDVCIYV